MRDWSSDVCSSDLNYQAHPAWNLWSQRIIILHAHFYEIAVDAIIKERKLKSSGSIKKEEKAYLEKLQKKLDDAHQKGTLDRTYTTAMTYELSILKSQVNKLKRSSGNNKSIAAFCNSSITSIDTILASYSKFSASKQ